MPKSSLDWLAVVCAWVGSIVLAVRSWNGPLMPGAPAFLASNFWNFTPAILLTVALAIFIYRLLRPVSATVSGQSESDDTDPNWEAKLELVTGKHFQNTEVLIDGKHFSHCKFHSVTFVYNGGHFKIENSDIGQHVIRTDKPPMERLLMLMAMFGHTKTTIYTERGPTTHLRALAEGFE